MHSVVYVNKLVLIEIQCGKRFCNSLDLSNVGDTAQLLDTTLLYSSLFPKVLVVSDKTTRLSTKAAYSRRQISDISFDKLLDVCSDNIVICMAFTSHNSLIVKMIDQAYPIV